MAPVKGGPESGMIRDLFFGKQISKKKFLSFYYHSKKWYAIKNSSEHILVSRVVKKGNDS
jgi:hypothetical protein